MNFTIVIDWKSISAFGLVVIGAILASKVDPSTAEQLLSQGTSACKDCIIAYSGDDQSLR